MSLKTQEVDGRKQQITRLRTLYTMGQLGFIFFSVFGFWMVKEGVALNQLAEVLVPMLAEMSTYGLEAPVEAWHRLHLESLLVKSLS